MDITLENPDAHHYVRRYQPGKITLNSGEHECSVIIHGDMVNAEWTPQSFEHLDEKAFEPLLERKPGIILLGTGAEQQFPDMALLAPFMRHNIGVDIMSTEAACRTYNILASEGRDVLAALLIK